MSVTSPTKFSWKRAALACVALLVAIPLLLIIGVLVIETRYGCGNAPVVELISRIKSTDVKYHTAVNTLIGNNYAMVSDSTPENVRFLCRSKVSSDGRLIVLRAQQNGVITGMMINGRIER